MTYLADLRDRYAPRCAACAAKLDYTRRIAVDAEHRSICDDCAKQPKERTVGQAIQQEITK